ncbi:MAG: hypothetical protein WCO33_00065 [bacterium]
MEEIELKLKDFDIKKDNFRRSRGGNTQILDIHCAKCNERVLIYQKDGIGSLQRTYLDRIIWPENFKDSCPPNLECPKCKTLIGVYLIYKPEKREAYKLIRGAFRKGKLK